LRRYHVGGIHVASLRYSTRAGARPAKVAAGFASGRALT
jgi:hypothetical protein